MTLSMYLKIPGVTGGSTDEGHVGNLDILAWSWGLSATGSALSGPGKGSWQDMSVTSYVDTATSQLMLSLMRGSKFLSMTLSIVSDSTPAPMDSYVMSNVLVTSVSDGGSGGEDRLTCNYSFSFSKVAATIANKHWNWDLATNTGG
jgi:type VI secretion system secreted protein Hcp